MAMSLSFREIASNLSLHLIFFEDLRQQVEFKQRQGAKPESRKVDAHTMNYTGAPIDVSNYR